MRLRRVVSGGQTGVDRAALDAASEAGLPTGGWCPAGRLSEDGRIPHTYPLRETPNPNPEQRTEWNVRDSDATLILYEGDLFGGTELTAQLARRMGRPYLLVDLRTDRSARSDNELGKDAGKEAGETVRGEAGEAGTGPADAADGGTGSAGAAVGRVHDWLEANRVSVLNVAGPRESGHPGIHSRAAHFLRILFTDSD